MTYPKYPEVNVQLSDMDGNAFSILARVSGALKRAGVDKTERDAFYNEATAGDYDALLRTAMRWVNVD
jgi:hypothetical protein